LQKQEVPTGASDTKRRLLDKIDELQEELEYQRVYQEEKDLQIENLNHMVTKLKSNLTEKDLEISSLEKRKPFFSILKRSSTRGIWNTKAWTRRSYSK
jgi:predicted RNase H-like nuclease (RuvC/YqgF family)